MQPAPTNIGGATVLRWTVIDDRHVPTGGCRHVVGGELLGPAAGLAVCRYEGEENVYLFGCDASWSPVTDTWHLTVEEAMEQAEHEYTGVSATWNEAS